ncbi:MAG: hypothetical protein K9N49_02095 [Candidatus Marinimicrobia bacterium]|nr:hypothetical protein [Candidatus Neomarinimicrobiota bacterium]
MNWVVPEEEARVALAGWLEAAAAPSAVVEGAPQAVAQYGVALGLQPGASEGLWRLLLAQALRGLDAGAMAEAVTADLPAAWRACRPPDGAWLTLAWRLWRQGAMRPVARSGWPADTVWRLDFRRLREGDADLLELARLAGWKRLLEVCARCFWDATPPRALEVHGLLRPAACRAGELTYLNEVMRQMGRPRGWPRPPLILAA